MLIVGLDLETTGIEIGDHKIIEYFGKSYGWDGVGEPDEIDEVYHRINPERSIALEAQRVHGITLSDLAHSPKWEAVAPEIHRQLDEAELVVAHNGKHFDLPFLNYEFERIGLSRIETPVVDTMLEGRWATPQGKVPTLGELCFACDVPYSTATGKAHAADYDVKVMLQCFFKGVRWGWFKLPEIRNAA